MSAFQIEMDVIGDECTTLKSSNKKSATVDIRFEDITYSVVKRNCNFWKSDEKVLLENISGNFRSGKLTGIIGSSGCGKTTLLNIISGYRTHVSGHIYVNGQIRDEKKFVKQSCYIMQDDDLQPLLTVQEAMTFVSNVKLKASLSKKDKQHKVNQILDSLSMMKCNDTLISSLSGGERKRLAVGLELISDPPVVLLDEPTSGLDSRAARHCVAVLQQLAMEGRTVVCTIHQPSLLLLNMFNNIYMLSSGRCMYQGTLDNLSKFMSSNGFDCPQYHNPVEYVLEQSVLRTDNFAETLINSIENGKSQQWLDSQTPSSTTIGNVIQHGDSDRNLRFATSFPHQLVHLLRRSFLVSSRNQILTRLKFTLNIAIGIVFGLFFRNIGNDASQIFVNFNFLFLCILFVTMNSLNSRIITFPSDLPVIKREHFNRWYSLNAYYISTIIGDTPVQALSVMIFSSIIYLLTGQPLEWYRMGQFVIVLVFIALLFQDYGILIGTLLNVQDGLIFGLFSMTPWLVFSGFFLYYRDTPVYFQWIYKISVLRHAVEALTTSIYGYGREKLDCSEERCRITDPDLFLKHLDVEPDNYSMHMLFIVCLFIGVKICCYLAVTFKFRAK